MEFTDFRSDLERATDGPPHPRTRKVATLGGEREHDIAEAQEQVKFWAEAARDWAECYQKTGKTEHAHRPFFA